MNNGFKRVAYLLAFASIVPMHAEEEKQEVSKAVFYSALAGTVAAAVVIASALPTRIMAFYGVEPSMNLISTALLYLPLFALPNTFTWTHTSTWVNNEKINSWKHYLTYAYGWDLLETKGIYYAIGMFIAGMVAFNKSIWDITC